MSTKGWKAEQGKVLKQRYSPEKWKTILASRKQSGLYYEDPDFPGDDDEPWLDFVMGKNAYFVVTLANGIPDKSNPLTIW